MTSEVNWRVSPFFARVINASHEADLADVIFLVGFFVIFLGSPKNVLPCIILFCHIFGVTQKCVTLYYPFLCED